MTKPVTGLTQWGASTTGSTGDLDDNFTAITTAINNLNTYSNYLTDTGAADAYAATLAANLTAGLSAGLKVSLLITNTNTGASTFNFNGTGALNIRTLNGASAVKAGMLNAGGVVDLILNSDATAWILQTPYTTGPVLLQSTTANNSAAVTFANVLSNTYNSYKVCVIGGRVENDGSPVLLRVANANGNVQSTLYSWAGERNTAAGVSTAQGSVANSAATAVRICAEVGNASAENFGGEIYISRLEGSTRYAQITAQMSSANTGAEAEIFVSGGFWAGNEALSGIQILSSNGNIVSGQFDLYGNVDEP